MTTQSDKRRAALVTGAGCVGLSTEKQHSEARTNRRMPHRRNEHPSHRSCDRRGLTDLGQACAEYQDGVPTDLTCERIECDEIWSFCYSPP